MLGGTPGKTDNNSSAPSDNAEKKTQSTKITNEILTIDRIKKATDNDEESTKAVNSKITPAKYINIHSNKVMDARDALQRPSKL